MPLEGVPVAPCRGLELAALRERDGVIVERSRGDFGARILTADLCDRLVEQPPGLVVLLTEAGLVGPAERGVRASAAACRPGLVSRALWGLHPGLDLPARWYRRGEEHLSPRVLRQLRVMVDQRELPSRRQAGRAAPPREMAGFRTRDLANELARRVSEADVPNVDVAALGLLGAEIDARVGDHYWNKFGFARNALAQIRPHPDFHAGLLTQGSGGVLEVGAGGLNPISPLIELMLRGGTPARSLDIDPIEREDLCARSAYRAALDISARTGIQLPLTVDWGRLRSGHLDAIPGDVWQFVCAPADQTGLPGASVGISLSNSFLEHVPDLLAVARELARVTAPGGIGVHRIDYSDHRRWSRSMHALEFLTDPSEVPLLTGCNRMRHHEVLKAFESVGFEVRRASPHVVVDIEDDFRARLAPRFADMTDQDLSVASATVYLRKPVGSDTQDARSVVRPQGAAHDIGASETPQAPGD